jgi:hypothetical protein
MNDYRKLLVTDNNIEILYFFNKFFNKGYFFKFLINHFIIIY